MYEITFCYDYETINVNANINDIEVIHSSSNFNILSIFENVVKFLKLIRRYNRFNKFNRLVRRKNNRFID